MMHDSTMDSGLGSAKSLSPRSPEPEWSNNVVDECEIRNEHLIADPTSVLFNILDVKENSWQDDDEPPYKRTKKDASNVLFRNSPSATDNVSDQNNVLSSLSGQKSNSNPSVSNLQNSLKTKIQNLKNGQSLLKENFENNSLSALKVSNFTEEATFGERELQNNCETPDLAHLQNTLRALIREVKQSSGENKSANSPSYTNPVVNNSNSPSKFTYKFTSAKCNNSGSTPKKEAAFKKSVLCASFPSRKKDSNLELRILSQPEEQHRARYLTEGSRGSIKDRRGTGFPTVKLFGYNKPVTLLVFIGTDQGRIQPHLFYQASQVCGKNSTPCVQNKIDGTTVLEIQMLPDKDMTVSCDCIGILKERNVDVEQRLANYGGTRNKKRSTRCRIIFRVTVPIQDSAEILQVASAPIICTQPPGIPEICRVSLSSCSTKGESELFIIGKNFLKDTKVLFKDIPKSFSIGTIETKLWEAESEPEKEYLQPTHLICLVPPYHKLDVIEAVKVHLYVQSGDKLSEPYPFIYTPLSSVISHPSVPVLSQELPLGVSASAVEINQQYSQTGTVPSVIQLPIMTTPPSKQMIVIPTVNSTLMTAGTTALPNTIHLGSPIMGGCSNTLLSQVKSPQLQLIVVQPSVPSVTKPEEVESSKESTSENSMSIPDISSKTENQNLMSVTINNNVKENLKMEARKNFLNQQCKSVTRGTENPGLNLPNVENRSGRDLEGSINDSSVIGNEWNVISNICNSLKDSQQQFSCNNSQEPANSALYHNTNKETQTLRELLLQGRQSVSSSSSPHVSTSINGKDTLTSKNEATSPIIIPDFAINSIITNSEEQNSEKLEIFSQDKNDYTVSNFSFQTVSSEKEANKQLDYSIHDIENLPSVNQLMYYDKYIQNDREILSSSLDNNGEKSDLYKIGNNSTTSSHNQMLSSKQPNFQDNDFGISAGRCNPDVITEQRERVDANKKKEVNQQNVQSIIGEGMTNNFQDVPNSGPSVDHFTDITMLPEMELLSMINPSTFDNV